MICHRKWSDEDKIIPREERYVFAICGLDRSWMDGLRCKDKIWNPSSLYSWSPPLPQVFKLNFDGASRGNLGPTDYGGVYRDSNGSILSVYLGAIGTDSNNSTKLEGLI